MYLCDCLIWFDSDLPHGLKGDGVLALASLLAGKLLTLLSPITDDRRPSVDLDQWIAGSTPGPGAL